MKTRLLLLALLTSAALTPALAAGTVAVNFVSPESFIDIGRGSVERERNLEMLTRHMTALGAQLPDGQTLTIDVLDVDLAGEVWPTRRLNEVRILKGSVDWPRMKVRWVLKAGDQTLRTGEDQLADMAYLMHTRGLQPNHELAYDVRMVNDWFRKTFTGAAR
jgi:Protein of unknown function (DUF3016)